jgi:hypothetical protein
LSGKLILTMGYGYEVKGRNDRKVTVGRKMTQLASETVLPGGVLVNDLPFRELSLWYWVRSVHDSLRQFDTFLNGCLH